MPAPPASSRGKMVNSFDPGQLAGIEGRDRELIERRLRLLGPAYRLFYTSPVEIVRGDGVHLYDRNGDEYLDVYNNVASVGHAHPRVTRAVCDQLATLCTHTRYLHEAILDYGEELLATFEPEISHLMLTCTGSEANDLALRIAMKHTGAQGIIVTAEAYHGNSHLTAGISPSLGQYSPLGDWVRRVPTPDTYRRAQATLGRWMATQVEAQIADLARHGQRLAAFIADSLFSSDGIYAEPADLLAPVAEVVRKAGGLFIADEVQAGFARSGAQMWGYQRYGVRPDIVTMGKPMGNGFPVAGIALRPEVVAAFGRDTRYFNTFGGNTVAVAAAQATFDVIRDERLQVNADRIGAMIREGVRALGIKHTEIGDVRGAGLFIGVEIVGDSETKAPDGQRASYIVNELRRRRVLISATGSEANILKLRPPLTFSERDADRLLTELEAALKRRPVAA